MTCGGKKKEEKKKRNEKQMKQNFLFVCFISSFSLLPTSFRLHVVMMEPSSSISNDELIEVSHSFIHSLLPSPLSSLSRTTTQHQSQANPTTSHVTTNELML